MTGGSFACQSKVLTSLRVLTSHRNWEIGVLSLLIFPFQRDDCQDLGRETFLGHKAARGWLKDSHTFQRDRERTYKFSNINALRKGLEILPWWVQWLRLHTPNAGSPGSIPGRGTRPHLPQLRGLMLQLNSPHAAMKVENLPVPQLRPDTAK